MLIYSSMNATSGNPVLKNPRSFFFSILLRLKVNYKISNSYNKRQSMTAGGYRFSFVEYIAVKKEFKL